MTAHEQKMERLRRYHDWTLIACAILAAMVLVIKFYRLMG